VVTGCAAQIDPQAFAAMEGVDLVLGNALKTAPGALSGSGVRLGDLPASGPSPAEVSGRAGRARAYVAIQTGCDHRCTFCVIPFGRGASRSQSRAKVVGQVRALAAAGFAEVVLTGVDLTSWGADIEGAPTLGDLVATVLDEVPELPRLRLSSIDAAEIDERLFELLGGEQRLMPHLHLSLQSGDDLILKRMRRRHSRTEALALIRAVRRARPQAAFGADFIAGFPTETEAAFENTLSFVDEAELAFLHVFPFSPRSGTPAARMPRVAPAVVHERAGRLRSAGEAALSRHLDRLVGKTANVLVERPGRGRAEDFTEVTFAGEARLGSLISGPVATHDGSRAQLATWERA
jgi:threonylcarbamoyladenosine tRNA methylthiotransferase MtaB